MRGEYDLSSHHCLQVARLLECHTLCKQLLAAQTTEQNQSVMGVAKGMSPPPSLPAMELHPQACLCQMCTNPQSLLHTTRLVVQCCDLILMKTRDKIEREHCVDSSMNLATVHLVADAVVRLREVIDTRIKKCDKVLQSVYTTEAVERSGMIIAKDGDSKGAGKERTKTKNSSRSTKSTRQKTKKFTKSPSSFNSDSALCSIAESTEFQCVQASIALTMSECSLMLEQPKEAIKDLESALSQLRHGDKDSCLDKEMGVARAWLHYQMGVACVQEVELRQPKLSAQLYEGIVRARDFSLALKHFLTCYQLCFPSLPAILTREVSQWVGLLVRGRRGEGGGAEIAAHFVNAGINCTLTHQTIYCLGKKIR